MAERNQESTPLPPLRRKMEQINRDLFRCLPKTIPIPESDIPKSLPKPNIPYPSQRDVQKSRDKASNQMEKIFQIFQDLRFDISFADALLLMPRFAPTIKSLLMNKEKLLELAKIPLNENCSAMLLKKFPKCLGSPASFLFPCNFPGFELSMPELTPTLGALGVSRSVQIIIPKGLGRKDVFCHKVRKFHFPTDFVVVDFEADPRVPLILGRSFLRTGRALIDVYGEEITLRVDSEAVTFNLDQTTRYTSTNDKSGNRIDIIDAVCEEYAPELLGFPNASGDNPTPTSEPFTSEFILEEIEAYLKDDSISPKIDYADCNPEEDICLIEKLLNIGPVSTSTMPHWVSPVLVVPKKGGISVVANGGENELIFETMIERLAGNEFYCFLDGFSGYFQIPIDPQDQEKTTFTCPYGTFATAHYAQSTARCESTAVMFEDGLIDSPHACAIFQVIPKVSHLHVVKRILRYLKGQPKLGLWYPKDSPVDLEAYTNSDYASASLDRKSITGGCQFLRSRLISWQCKKQTIVATSTTEAEYVTAASCCGQVLWIQNQMLDYGYNFMNTKIFIDNESTMCIVKNPVFHSKTKHIEIRHHFIRDSNEKKLI
ncbi:reverse transcriptase domain-containing protein [Tanacetum coccineum]